MHLYWDDDNDEVDRSVGVGEIKLTEEQRMR